MACFPSKRPLRDGWYAAYGAPPGPSEGVRAGQWRRQFAGQGIARQQADCLIAAATGGIEARLATGNPDDFPMDDITVEHWPVGR